MEEGALPSDKVSKQAEALAQKKKRLSDKKQSSKGSVKRRREVQGGAKKAEHRREGGEGNSEEEGGSEEDGDSEEEGGSEEDGESEEDGDSEEKWKSEANETDESGDSDDSISENAAEESEESEASGKAGRKRKGHSSPKPGASRDNAHKKKKVQHHFSLVLAPKRGKTGLSRAATKAMEAAKNSLMDLQDLRSALISVTSLWRQASSASDKSSCVQKILGLGQSIYNCGVYSEKSGCGADATDLLNKLAGLLRATDSNKSSSTVDEIDRLCSDLKGKAFIYEMLIKPFYSCAEKLSEVECDENDDSGKGKGDGTCTGRTTGSNSQNGRGSGKTKATRGGRSAKASEGSEKKDVNGSNTDVGMKMRSSEDSASTEKACLHCGSSTLRGEKVRLHECACGKVFHHVCAGILDHTQFATCYDCAQQKEPSEVAVAKASTSDRRSKLKKTFDTLSEAHKSLMSLSSEVELCRVSESKQKKQEFDMACAAVKDHTICAYQAWFQSKSATPAQTKELQVLIGLVLELVKGTRQFSEIDFVRKKVQGKIFFFYLIVFIISSQIPGWENRSDHSRQTNFPCLRPSTFPFTSLSTPSPFPSPPVTSPMCPPPPTATDFPSPLASPLPSPFRRLASPRLQQLLLYLDFSLSIDEINVWFRLDVSA